MQSMAVNELSLMNLDLLAALRAAGPILSAVLLQCGEMALLAATLVRDLIDAGAVQAALAWAAR